VADARLDNRAELAVLARDGERIEDIDDATLILRAYARWGVECTLHLLGDFAFAIWDDKQQRLLCARDPMGVRTLYYAERDGWWVCANEQQALFAGTGIVKEPNVDAVTLYMGVHSNHSGETLYRHVRALAPAHRLVVGRDGVELARYWAPDPWTKLELGDDAEYERIFADTFQQAIRSRVERAEGGVGVLVSGGIDSSAVACQAAALGAEPLAMRVSFPTMSCDETRYSQSVVDKWGLELLDVDAIAAAGPEPRMDHPDVMYHPNLVPYGLLLNQARERGIGTVLTGLSGDQWMDETGMECVDALRELRLTEAATIAGVFRTPLSRAPYQKLWTSLKRAVPESVRIKSHAFRPFQPLPLLSERAAREVRSRSDADRLARLERWRYPDRLSQILCEQLEAFPTQMPMIQHDLLASRMGVEAAHPFMDRRIFELMLSVPRSQRVAHGVPKAKPLLRRALRDELPDAVRSRTDFAEVSCYIRYALLTKHGRWLENLVSSSRLAEFGVVDPQQLRTGIESGFEWPLRPIYLGLFTSMEFWLRHNWP
jgi:asparagine synthase (glutamine-hydrolysing)